MKGMRYKEYEDIFDILYGKQIVSTRVTKIVTNVYFRIKLNVFTRYPIIIFNKLQNL